MKLRNSLFAHCVTHLGFTVRSSHVHRLSDTLGQRIFTGRKESRLVVIVFMGSPTTDSLLNGGSLSSMFVLWSVWVYFQRLSAHRETLQLDLVFHKFCDNKKKLDLVLQNRCQEFQKHLRCSEVCRPQIVVYNLDGLAKTSRLPSTRLSNFES